MASRHISGAARPTWCSPTKGISGKTTPIVPRPVARRISLRLLWIACGKDDRLVEYVESEPFTTKDKKVDLTLSRRDLGHAPQVPLAEGIPLTVAWMKSVYGL